jgi:hypothetical protein
MSKLITFILSEDYEAGKIYAITAEDDDGNRYLVCEEVFASKKAAKDEMKDYPEEDYTDLKVASFKPSLV